MERLQRRVRDYRANYKQSLSVLRMAKELQPRLLTKTSIMLGVGETDVEIRQTLVRTYKTDLSTSCCLVSMSGIIHMCQDNFRQAPYQKMQAYSPVPLAANALYLTSTHYTSFLRIH